MEDTRETLPEGTLPEGCSEPRSWMPEQFTEGKWYTNALRFRTRAEAEASALNTYSGWMNSTGHRAMPSEDEPNYAWDESRERGLRQLTEEEMAAAKGVLLKKELPSCRFMAVTGSSCPVGMQEWLCQEHNCIEVTTKQPESCRRSREVSE